MPQATLDELNRRLATLAVPFEDWDVLYRQRLQLAADDRLTDGRGRATADEGGEETGGASRPGKLEVAAALGVTGLVATDVALQVAERLRPSGDEKDR